MNNQPVRTILFVTESAFALPYQGDSARLFRMITYLRGRGHRIAVVHFHDRTQTHARYDVMRAHVDALRVYRPTDADLEARAAGRMDDWCPPGFVDLVRRTAREAGPDAVIVQFVFFSRCLDALDLERPPLRILDADNVFTDRSLLYARANLPYAWFSTDAEEERAGLARADLLLAIQERELAHFARVAPDRPALLVPHVLPARRLGPPRTRDLLFIGAGNDENAAGLTAFLEGAWPAVRARHPDVALRVAGGVCDRIGARPGVELLRVIDDLTDLYAAAGIVLNTAPVGTGLKIKTVEALCHGRCLVSTPEGVQGLERYPDVYRLARGPAEFAEILVRLLDDPGARDETAERAFRFAARYFDPERALAPLEWAIERWAGSDRGARRARAQLGDRLIPERGIRRSSALADVSEELHGSAAPEDG